MKQWMPNNEDPATVDFEKTALLQVFVKASTFKW